MLFLDAGLHKLKNLEALDLSFNNINGTVERQGKISK